MSTENFKNTLGVWASILSCSYLLLHSNSGVGCLSLEPWGNVAHGALGCSDVYGMLQKVVVGLCHVRSHTLEHDHKISSQRVLSVFLWKSLVPYLFPLYTFCSVFVCWGSPILWKGCCLSIILATQLNLVSFEYTPAFLPQKDTAQLTHVIVLLFLWIQVQTCASKFHCTAWQQLLVLQAFATPPFGVHGCFYYLSPHQHCLFSISSKFLIVLYLFFDYSLSFWLFPYTHFICLFLSLLETLMSSKMWCLILF